MRSSNQRASQWKEGAMALAVLSAVIGSGLVAYLFWTPSSVPAEAQPETITAPVLPSEAAVRAPRPVRTSSPGSAAVRTAPAARFSGTSKEPETAVRSELLIDLDNPLPVPGGESGAPPGKSVPQAGETAAPEAPTQPGEANDPERKVAPTTVDLAIPPRTEPPPSNNPGRTPDYGSREPAETQTAARRAPGNAAQPTVTVSAGTVLAVRPLETLNSANSSSGDQFRAVLARALDLENGAAIPAGAYVAGTVLEAQPSVRVKGRARLSLTLDRIHVQGKMHSITAQRVDLEAKSTVKRDAAAVGVSAAVGTILGGLLGGKKGAARGAVIGGAAGGAGAALAKGREVHVSGEDTLEFGLAEPLAINWQESAE